MNTLKPKKGGKRPQVKKPSLQRSQVKKPSLHSYALKADWFAGLPSVPQLRPTVPAAPQFLLSRSITPIPQPQKSFGELLFELGWEIYKHVWKQTAPTSYNANQAMFALAPYLPPERRWVLGVGAVGTAIYGFGQVSDRVEKAIDRKR